MSGTLTPTIAINTASYKHHNTKEDYVYRIGWNCDMDGRTKLKTSSTFAFTESNSYLKMPSNSYMHIDYEFPIHYCLFTTQITRGLNTNLNGKIRLSFYDEEHNLKYKYNLDTIENYLKKGSTEQNLLQIECDGTVNKFWIYVNGNQVNVSDLNLKNDVGLGSFRYIALETLNTEEVINVSNMSVEFIPIPVSIDFFTYPTRYDYLETYEVGTSSDKMIKFTARVKTYYNKLLDNVNLRIVTKSVKNRDGVINNVSIEKNLEGGVVKYSDGYWRLKLQGVTQNSYHIINNGGATKRAKFTTYVEKVNSLEIEGKDYDYSTAKSEVYTGYFEPKPRVRLVEVDSSNSTNYVGEPAWVKVQALDDDGNPVPSARLVLSTFILDDDENIITDERIVDLDHGQKIANIMVELKTDSNGRRKIGCVYPEDYTTGATATCAVIFSPQEGYNRTETGVYLRWNNRENSFVEIENTPAVKYNQTAKTKLKLYFNNQAVTNKDVTFKIKKVTYDDKHILSNFTAQTMTTDDEGCVSLNYNLPVHENLGAVVEYTVTYKQSGKSVAYTGNWKFEQYLDGKDTMLVMLEDGMVMNTPVQQMQTVKVRLVDSEGIPVSNKVLNISGQGWTYNRTTDKKGVVSLQVVNDTPGVIPYYVRFGGDSQYNTTELEIQFTFIPDVGIDIVNKTDVVPARSNVSVDVQLVGLDNISNKTITARLICRKPDDTIVDLGSLENHTLTTNSRGEANLTFRANIAGTYTILFGYEVNSVPLQTNTEVIVTLIPTRMILSSVPYYNTGTPATVTAQVVHAETGEVIKNKNVQCDLTITDEQYNVISVVHSSSKDKLVQQTDTNGEVSLSYTSNIDDTIGVFEFNCYSDNSYAGCIENVEVRWSKPRSVWTIKSNTGETEVLQSGRIVATLKDETTGEVLTGRRVKTTATFKAVGGGTVVPDPDYGTKTYTTYSNGNLAINYTSNKGDVVGTFKYDFEGDDDYKGSSITAKITWNKIETGWTLKESETTGDIEVTLPATMVATLKDVNKDEILTGITVDGRIDFTTLDGKSAGLDPIMRTNLKTNSHGNATIEYTNSTIGDIKGKWTLAITEDDVYKGSSISHTITWNKIKTHITTRNFSMYAGRYTALNEDGTIELNTGETVDWTTQSPGVDTSYRNLRAVLQTLNTETEYNYLSGRTITFENSSHVVKDTRTTDSWGVARGRYTVNLGGTNPVHLWAVYEGDDIFKSSSHEIEITLLPREQPTLEKWVQITHPPGVRYNVPFDFGAKLKSGNTALKGQKVVVTFEDITTRNLTTHTDGTASILDYVAKIVKNATVTANFNQDDLIDRYLPATLTYKINVEKDFVILTMRTGASKYISCYTATVYFNLKDSMERYVSEDVYLYYDDGSYKSVNMTPYSTECITTSPDNEDVTIKFIQHSGVWILFGEFRGTWCYKEVTEQIPIIYEISREYEAEVVDGKAEIPVDCFADATHGLPEGLYDVEIEYIPPEANSGWCMLYSSATNKQPMRKKRATKLTNVTTNTSIEAYKPLFITVVLSTLNGNSLPNEKVFSSINGTNKSTPAHVTSESGRVSRGSYSATVGATIDYDFFYDQSRKYAPCELNVKANVTKMQPTLKVGSASIVGWKDREMTFTATLYHQRKKYGKFGYEVKADADGNEVYYNVLTDEYYQLIDGVHITKNKDYYDNATSIITKTPLKNRTVVWRGISGVTELVRATTNSDGVATATYIRKNLGDTTIYATTEEEEKYFGCTTSFAVTTIDLIQPYFKETINFPATTYKHSTKLYSYLYYKDSNNVEKPMANQTVIFRQGTTVLGTATTNSSGYAEFYYTVTSKSTFPFLVRFEGYDGYHSAYETYTIVVNKQTPVLTLSMEELSGITLGDKVTLVATFNGDSASGGSPVKDILLSFYDGTEKIGERYTNSSGEARLSYTTKNGGSRTFKVVYAGNNPNYANAEKTYTKSITKETPRIISSVENPYTVPGGTAQSIMYSFEDKYNNPLPYKTLKVTYNGSTKSIVTDYASIFYIDTGTADKGTERTITIKFEGDSDYNTLTYTQNIKWGDYLDTEDCTDLDAFDIILENWYASDGTAKFGVDVNNLNNPTKCKKWEGLTSTPTYKRNCSPINEIQYKNILLRKTCNDLKTNGEYDEKEERVSAPTGVVMRSKRLTTSSKCSVSFYFQVKYGGGNDKIATDQFGGHFGLMQGGKNITTAELAPVRFEFYRKNTYMILSGGEALWSNLQYSLSPNTKYQVVFDINDKKVSITIYNSSGTKVKSTQTWTSPVSLAGLYPYVFSYTNDTTFVISEIKITRND